MPCQINLLPPPFIGGLFLLIHFNTSYFFDVIIIKDFPFSNLDSRTTILSGLDSLNFIAISFICSLFKLLANNILFVFSIFISISSILVFDLFNILISSLMLLIAECIKANFNFKLSSLNEKVSGLLVIFFSLRIFKYLL